MTNQQTKNQLRVIHQTPPINEGNKSSIEQTIEKHLNHMDKKHLPRKGAAIAIQFFTYFSNIYMKSQNTPLQLTTKRHTSNKRQT